MNSEVVDVVIMTWNDGPLVRAAVDSVFRECPLGVEVNVAVVDNGSELPPDLPDDPRITLITNEVNRGVSVGRNQGLAVGNSPLVLFLDSDAQLCPSTLPELLAQLEEPTVGAVAPVFVDQRPEESAGLSPTFTLKALRALNIRDDYDSSRPSGAEAWEIDFAISACLLVRREVLDTIGGFDEDYFYGPEDIDLCLRTRQQGWTIRQTERASCLHPPRRRHKNLLTKGGVRHGVNVVRHLWRHRSSSTRLA